MADTRVLRRDGLPEVTLALSGRDDGDLAVDGDPEELAARRRRVLDGPWTWLRQVHGADVVEVAAAGEHAGAHADAAVTAVPGAVLAVHTADCAGVLLVGTGGPVPVVGAAHAGWRGLHAGVLQATVAAVRGLGATKVEWLLGPCIGPDAYEFGPGDLALLVDRFGPGVAATTLDGAPALDLRAGVRLALSEVGAVPLDAAAEVPCTATGPSTATSSGWYSWRARRDVGRQAAAVRIGPPTAGDDR